MNEKKNRVALVTGGSQGIGKEIATKLAESNIITWIAARTREKIDETVAEIEDLGGTAFGYQVDVSETDKLQSMIDEINSESGIIDILVNNAGTGEGGKPTWLTDQKKWWNVMEVNVRGPLVLCNLVLGDMVERNWGTIINMSSFASIRPTPVSSSYGVSKTALTRLTETLAVETTDYNIGIFPISPGLVYTEMTKDIPVFKDLPKSAWTPVEEAANLVMKLVSGRYHKLSGRFIHVSYNLDEMLKQVNKIIEDNSYTLRLTTMDGVEK